MVNSEPVQFFLPVANRQVSPDAELNVDAAEGVLQAEKDFNLASHPEIEGIPNLQVHDQLLQYAAPCTLTRQCAAVEVSVLL